MNADWRERYEKAIDIAKKAGRIALDYFDQNLQVEIKGDSSPVTLADRRTEAFLREELQQAFPKDGFLGEEYGSTPGSSGYRWIIDPIDGTRSFIRGIPLWATLLGLEFNGELIAGIVDAAPLGHTYHALRGQGSFRNDRPIQVSQQGELAKSIVFYSSLSWFLKAGKEKEFIELVKRSERQRGYGDWYGFLLVAQGSGEVMVEEGVHAWDIAALIPIVEEAGGKMTDWDGRVDILRSDVIATNGLLHEETLGILQGRKG